MRHAEIASPNTISEVQAAEFVRVPSVMRRTGLARSTIYRFIAERKFPAP